MASKFHKHLIQIINKHRVLENRKIEIKNKVEKIKKKLKPINKYNPRVSFGGSYKKKTMVRGNYDVDIVIFFPHTTTESPKELKELVKDVLKEHYPVKSSYGIALKVTLGYLEIDIIVGKAKSDKFKFADAYNSRTQGNMRISIDVHQKNVAGNQKMVKLMKIWRIKHNLSWSKLAMEGYVVRLFDNSNDKDLGECFQQLLLAIKSNILTIKFTDPANSNNPITVPDNERRRVQKLADNCLEYYKNEEFDNII